MSESPTEQKKQEFPMRLQVHLGDKIIALKTLSITECEFEDGDILDWMVENDMSYTIPIDRDKNQVEIKFASPEDEAYFIMRWIEGASPE